MSALSVITYVASGNIGTGRFVALVSGSDFRVVQAVAADKACGISQYASQEAPGTAADSGYAATDGKLLRVYGPGEEAIITAGGNVSAGDYLIPDANGKGVAASLTATTHQDLGAFALQTGASGSLLRVRVVQLPARQT